MTFEKETAAKTALLLDNTQLGANQVHVTSAASLDELAGGRTAHPDENVDDLSQEDKPRSRIFAEYLAHGYVLSDKAIERAIALDQQHGVSNRFTTTLQNFDNKFKASEKAQALDHQYGISARANQGWRGLSSYFEKAAETPTGQRVRAFYAQGQKQVLDVHNEARHLAGLKSGKAPQQGEGDLNLHNVAGTDRTACNCGAQGGVCQCAPGKCGCSSCPKNPDEKSTTRSAEEAEMEFVEVDGQKKTKCNCGGVDGKCPCEPGKCACSGCSKAS